MEFLLSQDVYFYRLDFYLFIFWQHLIEISNIWSPFWKQGRVGSHDRCVTSARAATKETVSLSKGDDNGNDDA